MVRVLIERRVPEGMTDSFHQVLREMRWEAIQRPGYISGESFRDAKDPRHYVVLSTWQSAEAWESWSASEARARVMARIRPLLAGPEEITVLEPV
jgi:quinol monooxygenase YgiN